MGYSVYIIKSDHPVRSKQNPITSAEWTQVVKSDPELEFEGRGFRTALMSDAQGDEVGRLVFQNGRIISKSPNDLTIEKMKVIAARLSAKVQGDDGTVFIDRRT
jgi:hypothetical protein